MGKVSWPRSLQPSPEWQSAPGQQQQNAGSWRRAAGYQGSVGGALSFH